MKLAMGYSTKDQVELTEQTLPRVGAGMHLYWCDGSQAEEGKNYFSKVMSFPRSDRDTMYKTPNLYGGADAAIAWKLSKMLASSEHYSHIMLLENDVLLDKDWFEPTIALFEKGERDGLAVGAVSARSYVDRVLIQRYGYAVMHNLGAGMVIFTREAAEIVLQTFRTHWWPYNVKLFGQLAGIDLRTYACFHGNEQWVTTDWGWEAQLARHGLASLALTPSKASMIGQVPPLHEQGLELTTKGWCTKWHDEARFEQYRTSLKRLGPCTNGTMLSDGWSALHRAGAGLLVFPHQLGYLAGSSWQGTLELQNSQGFGPFSYRAGPGGATLSVHVSSSCCFLATGGVAGARVTIEDHRSGFKAQPSLPPAQGQPVSISVPGGPVPRLITMRMEEGAVFYGLQTSEPQMIDTTFRFSWDQLPNAT